MGSACLVWLESIAAAAPCIEAQKFEKGERASWIKPACFVWLVLIMLIVLMRSFALLRCMKHSRCTASVQERTDERDSFNVFVERTPRKSKRGSRVRAAKSRRKTADNSGRSLSTASRA